MDTLVGIVNTANPACRLASDNVVILKAFVDFLANLTDTGANVFTQVVMSVNPEYADALKRVIYSCIGDPS